MNPHRHPERGDRCFFFMHGSCYHSAVASAAKFKLSRYLSMGIY